MSTTRAQANNDKVKHRFTEAMEDIDKAMSNSNFNAFYVCKNLLSCRAEFGQDLTGHLTAFLGTSAAVQLSGACTPNTP